MDDVTDTVFRQIVADCTPPDIFFSEFVNVDGLVSQGRTKLVKKLQFTDKDNPLIAQLWGKEPANFKTIAHQIASGSLAKELGLAKGINFYGVDLNMGCPQKNEVKAGTCSALINNRQLAQEIIEATKEGLDNRLPLSVKTRLGWNEIDLSWHEFLLKQKLNMLTIHGRTRKEMSKVPAHWEHIGKVKELRDKLSPNTLIVGNGDVLSRQQGLSLAKRYDLDGIMIGRGIFKDPFVFSENSPWLNKSSKEKLELFKKHVNLFKSTWEGEKPVQVLNKFCKVYINGLSNAKELREQIMASTNINDLISLIDNLLLVSDSLD